MKTVIVRLEGWCDIFLIDKLTEGEDPSVINDFSYLWELEDEGLTNGDMREYRFMKTIDKLSYSVNGGESIDIVKKGKYITTRNYIGEDFLPPYVVQHSDAGNGVYEFSIELADDEEFDPMKLQLEKSDYEVQFLPFGIITSHIWYDGKPIGTDTEDNWGDTGEDLFYYDEKHPFA